jgi:hypothetical protein
MFHPDIELAHDLRAIAIENSLLLEFLTDRCG